MALPNDSPLKAIFVTLAVCFVASILVAGSAVLLKPLQEANKERERLARIDEIAALLPGVEKALEIEESIRVEARVVDLATGRYVPSIDPANFDQRSAAKDPSLSVPIPPERDLAQIGRRANFAVVYLVLEQERLRAVIIPVRGRGFGSMLHGYLGLSGDLRTAIGLSFYQHGETPGLGALIDDPEWRSMWQGKRVWAGAGDPGIGVAEGPVEPDSPEAEYLVEGLTGATWTSRGVTNLLRFWLGSDGFGPFLRNIPERRG
ncbi:MAG: Na(+)-translocating NADH-quinone reductase subunit C [Hyphomicrobiales bacterium]|nr:Na(+)-translocating NADH-quinone reductase subunit C [Hyphomicrobiales bacterium]